MISYTGKIVGTTLIFLLTASFALADLDKGCQEKEKALEEQLAIAREHGNAGKIRGIEKALYNVRTWCTDAKLKDKAALEVREKEQDVRERQNELEEARQSGKTDKIRKRETKLQKAEQELQDAREAKILLD